MWICPRCHSENREAAAACENCGATRSAGRFGSSPQQPRRMQPPSSPRISTPAGREQREPEMPRSSARNEYPVPEMDLPRAKHVKRSSALFSRIVGVLLSVLLPVLVGLLAWRQYDVLSPALTGLLLPEDAADWMRIGCYAALGVVAALLALLPGLWTLLLARSSRDRR